MASYVKECQIKILALQNSQKLRKMSLKYMTRLTLNIRYNTADNLRKILYKDITINNKS